MSACTVFFLFFLFFHPPHHVRFYILRVMIHQPASSLMDGKIGEGILDADELIILRDTIVQIYAQTTGKPSWQISKDMERDFFMSAEEAQAYGIVDMVADSI